MLSRKALKSFFNNLHYILGNVSYPKERSFTLYVTKTILSDYSKNLYSVYIRYYNYVFLLLFFLLLLFFFFLFFFVFFFFFFFDVFFIIGIKHGFSCIIIRQVPREVLKPRPKIAVIA